MNYSKQNGGITMKDHNHLELKSSTFLHSFWRVNRSMMRFAHKTALENDLSMPQYSVLMIIAPQKEMTQKQLGEILQMPKSTLSQAVDGLVQSEWIQRKPVEDNRREMHLILSEKGISLFNQIKSHKNSIHQTLESIISTMDTKRYEELQATLTHIADLLESETHTKGCKKND